MVSVVKPGYAWRNKCTMLLALWKLAVSRQRKHGWAAYIPDIRCRGWKDVEVAIDVCVNGADMVVEEDQSDREGII